MRLRASSIPSDQHRGRLYRAGISLRWPPDYPRRLEDHFCGKLLGVPMGCDICYTNHAQADQDDMDNLLTLLGVANVNFIMGVPGADDVMLNYQSTSFHDALYVREVLNLRRAPEFEAWLEAMRIVDSRGALLRQTAQQPLLEAALGEDAWGNTGPNTE